MRMTLKEHFDAVDKIRRNAQDVINSAMSMHEAERVRIDDQIASMNILAFGVVGAVLALNAELSINNIFVLAGLLLLVGNAFWNFIAQHDQMRINRDTAKNKAEHVAAALKEFLDVYRSLCKNPTDDNEQKLDEAGEKYFDKFNEKAMTYAPQTKLTKCIGKGYFVFFAFGLILIGIGFICPIPLVVSCGFFKDVMIHMFGS